MLKVFTERTLPVLQVIGMLGTSLIITLGLGLWFTWTFIDHFERTLAQIEDQTRASQAALLDQQMASLIAQIDHNRTSTETVLKNNVRQETGRAVALLQGLYSQLRDTLPEAQLKALMIEALRPLRFFSGRGYPFIVDGDGVMLLHPVLPEMEGSIVRDQRDSEGRRPFDAMLSSEAPDSDGFARYTWPVPGRGSIQHKMTHVRRFGPYGWLVGAGDYLEAVDAEVRTRVLPEIRAVRFGASGTVMVFALDEADPDPGFAAGIAPARLDADEAWVRRQPGGEAVLDTVRAAATQGGGTLTLDWPSPDGVPVPRLVRVGVYAPWQWILVAGIDQSDLADLKAAQRGALLDHVEKQIRLLIITVIAVLVISGGFALVFALWMNKILRRYRQDLEQRTQALAESERRLRLSAQVFENASEAVVITDTENRIVTVNPAFTRVTGYPMDKVRGQGVGVLASDRHDPRFLAAMRRTLRENGSWIGEAWIRRVDGSVFLSWLSVSQARSDDGLVTHHIGTFADITDRKAADERIRQLAYFDPLTQLPNRLLLRSRLTQAMAAAERLTVHGAVLFIDLDNFKTLNDTRGHDIGDKLLIEVARRLRDTVRERDLVARLGGDEFVVVLPHLDADGAEAATQVERVADKILARLNEPCAIEGVSHVVTPSIGACLFSGQNETVDTLLKHADTAMYQAKARGRNRLSFFEPAIQEALLRRSRLEADMRDAVHREEFVLYYQPQVDHTGTLVGAEVLVRWQHPHAGLLLPGEFISLAEETGLIGVIGRQVLEKACAQIATWDRLGLGHAPSLAVNVSAVQFRDPNFVSQVLSLIDRTGIDPSRLKLELTESLILDDVQGSIRTMNRLKADGLGFSMDDFGTGYSSLSYLKRLPLDQLKIDRSFIEDVTHDPNDAVIVRTIIAMSRSLGLDVLAEGVERPDQRSFLVANGCLVFQGYLFSPPVDTGTFEGMLAGGMGFSGLPLP